MRTGSDHRTIPAKIFVENLNCPELTASFLAGAKDLWRIQKTACLLLPPLLYLGSSGQFPEWLTFDVSDPKVLRGDHKGTPLKGVGGAFSAQPTQVGTHGLPQEDKDTPARRHSSRRTRRPLRRPSASLRSFQKATHTLGPTSPLQLTLLQDLPRAPLGDYRQGYL